MGVARIHQALLWSDGLVSWKSDQGGKGGGKGGSTYIYASDVIAGIANGPITSVAQVWDGQSWLSTGFGTEAYTVTVNGVYAPENSSVLVANNGVSFETTYDQTYNDYQAPAATVLSGTDFSPLIEVPYGTVLTSGEYSVNPISIGTFAVTSCGNASGGSTVYNGTFTGGESPYASGASNAYVGFNFVVAGFTVNLTNNGTFTCQASTATSVTLNNAVGIAETATATAADTGNSYHFYSGDAGQTAMVTYQYTIQDLQQQEVSLIPSSGQIVVGGTFNPTYDLGVWYYNTNGGSGPNTLVKLTSVNGTPTAAGEYHFSTPGIGSTGGATYTFYTDGGAGGDYNQEVLITWRYQNLSLAQGNSPNLLNFELFGGGLGQEIWPFILTGGKVLIGNQDGGQAPSEPAFPGAALGYSNTAYLAYGPIALGAQAEMPDITVEATTPYSYGGAYSTGVDEGSAIVDCNPVTCIYTVLTNTVWGLGNSVLPFPLSALDSGVSGTWGSAAGGYPPNASATYNPANAAQTGTDWHNVSYLRNPTAGAGTGVPYNENAESTSTIYVNGFGGAVPSTADITGVQVFWTGSGFDTHGTGVSSVVNVSLETSPGVVAGIQKVGITQYVNSFNNAGSSTDTWGLILTPAMVNSPTFGVGFDVGPGASYGTDLWNCYIVVYWSTVAPPSPGGTHTTNSTAWNWFASNSFFISPVLDAQDAAASTMGAWLEAGMCAAYFSEGLLKLVPYGTQSSAGNGCTWVAPSEAIVSLDDTDFVTKDGEEPVKITRSAWQDAMNEVQIKWHIRAYQYADELTQEFNQAAINRFGLRLEEPKDWDFITTLSAAQFAAIMRVKRLTSIRNTYDFKLPFTFSYLEPMDLVEITTSSTWANGLNNLNLGIINLPVRITKIIDDPVDGLAITCEDSLFAAGLPTLFNKGSAQGNAVLNAYLQPGNAEVILFEATSRLTGQVGNQIWIGALGTTSNWGSTNVYVSNDNTKYQIAGSIEAPARLGVLASTFASGSDPDTVNTLVVTMAENSAALEAGTSTDADNGNTLCFCDGEILSYSACAVTALNQYTMGTYIRRGQMNSTISSHAAGALFMRLDTAILKYTYDPTWAGQTLYFKFQSVNPFGNCAQDLSALTATQFTVPGKNPGTVEASSGLVIGQQSNVGNGIPAWNPVA
jgi:hypothetical protein